MTAKQYLSQIRDFDVWIKNYKTYSARLGRDIDALKSLQYDKMRVQGGKGRRTFEGAIDALTDYQRDAERRVQEYILKRDRIVNQINSLKYPYCEILYKHYVERKTLTEVYQEMPYTHYNSVARLHGFALAMFRQAYLQGAGADDVMDTVN